MGKCCDQQDYVMRVCRVCELIDNDNTRKLCKYCRFCSAYICSPCQSRYDKRFLAAIKNQVKP